MQLSEDSKKKINTVFGFLVEQPLHETLRKMRVLPTLSLAMAWHLMYKIIDLIIKLDPLQAAVALGGIALALLTLISKAFDSFIKRHEKDE